MEKVAPVSTTAKPVTDTAEVEVKRAFNQPISLPGSEEIGSDNKMAPIKMGTAKLKSMIRDDDK
ncbi:hypothetical protein D3C85_1791430 [compost metagenome]